VKIHPSHKEILEEIVRNSGQPTKHTFLEKYLGNEHPRYPVSSPVLRKIAKSWAERNRHLSAEEFRDVVSSLIQGKSFTEKVLGGILLDYAHYEQRKFNISIFDEWLTQLQGWAEVDAVCTGKFQLSEVPLNFKKWKPVLEKFSRSTSTEKRRASLVCYCSPISHCDDPAVADAALKNIDALKAEKEILITKAISWLLRSMIRHHHGKVEEYLSQNKNSLPAIAVRETLVKLKTGKKSARKVS
jgi:3-methyladenine DNA glycosylase AlkD